MTYANLTVYEGQWKSGLYHGNGLLLKPKILKYEGDFEEGKYSG